MGLAHLTLGCSLLCAQVSSGLGLRRRRCSPRCGSWHTHCTPSCSCLYGSCRWRREGCSGGSGGQSACPWAFCAVVCCTDLPWWCSWTSHIVVWFLKRNGSPALIQNNKNHRGFYFYQKFRFLASSKWNCSSCFWRFLKRKPFFATLFCINCASLMTEFYFGWVCKISLLGWCISPPFKSLCFRDTDFKHKSRHNWSFRKAFINSEQFSSFFLRAWLDRTRQDLLVSNCQLWITCNLISQYKQTLELCQLSCLRREVQQSRSFGNQNYLKKVWALP